MAERRALHEAIGAAVADGTAIDWEAIRADARGAADGDLIEQFRVIAAIGAGRKTRQTSNAIPWSAIILPAYALVLAIAAAKFVVALIWLPAAVSRTSLMGVPYAVNIVLFGIAGLVLLAGGMRDRRVQLLGGLFLLITSAFVQIVIPPATDAGGATFVALVGRLQPEAFLALGLWLFVWAFPSPPKTRPERLFAGLFTGTSFVLGVLLFGTNAIGSQPWANRLPALADVASLFNRQAPHLAYWPVLFGAAVPAIPALLWKSRLEPRESRRKTRLFVVGLGIGLTPMVLAVIASPFVPALSDPEVQQLVGIGLYVALASIVPITAYAVAVDRVMDLQFVVHATKKYALARHAMWGASLGPLAWLAFDLYLYRDLTIGQYATRGQPIALMALLAICVSALALRAQMIRAVDRWFLREPADYSPLLAQVEQGFRTAGTLGDITRVVTDALEQSLYAQTAAVLLVNQDANALVSLEGSTAPLPMDSALLDLLRATRSEMQLGTGDDGPIRRLLPGADRHWLSETRVQLLSPLVGSNGSLLGVIAVGEPGNGIGYTPRQSALVTTLSGQAAMQIENRWLRELPRDADEPRLPGVDWHNEPASFCPACLITGSAEKRACACGAATVPAALPQYVKGKFRVDRLIGSGGTGVVYLGVDITLGRKVAIKTLPAMRRENAVRLNWEARAMAAVTHPNLALIYGAEAWRGTPMLIVEYLEGGTLLEALRRGPASIGDAIELGIVLADVLDRVHGAGLLHRDIKPSNIGYTADGLPKLLDFGLAAILDRAKGAQSGPVALPKEPADAAALLTADPSATLTVTQQLLGTPLYLSPEALRGVAPQASFDLWSLAMVMYEAVAGRHPLAGGTVGDVIAAVQRAPVPDVRDFRPDCPALLAGFLGDALSLVPSRRPATAHDFRTHLRWLQMSLPPVAC